MYAGHALHVTCTIVAWSAMRSRKLLPSVTVSRDLALSRRYVERERYYYHYYQ